MLQRQVDPALLVRVTAPDGRAFHVLREVHEGPSYYLNTYSKHGKLKTSRGCTMPISRFTLGQGDAA